MPLKPEYNGDAMKAPGAFLAVSKNKKTGEVLGLYVISDEGNFIRGNRVWITATGLALYQLHGSRLVQMDPAFIDKYDVMDETGKVPSVEEIAAGGVKGRPGSWDSQNPPDNDASGAGPATIRRAWQCAGRIVAFRPWLEVSWVDGDGVPGHLAAHDGPYGAALHFDDDEGPTWVTRSAPDQELEWGDVEGIDSVNAAAAVDWVERWGTPALEPELTAKAAIYVLTAHLLDSDSTEGRWSVRPGRLVHYTDESADAPDSAFSLTTVFSSLAPPVQWYVDQITSPSWGQGTIWHEPLWLVERDAHPRLVLDEAGQVHMTADSLPEVLAVMAAATDLGGIDDPYSFDLLDALPRVGGDFAGLAALLRQGPAETLRAVKPKSATPATTGTTIASDTTNSGEVEDSIPTEDRLPTEDSFPNACSDVHDFNTELLRWLTRTPHGATLGQSHDSIVTTVPIGGEQCVLRGGSTREGVATYLARTLGGSAPFFVVPSTKMVVHRLTAGRDTGRIRGFYLYTPSVYQEPRPIAAADGSGFGVQDVWFKLMDAVAWLHSRGHQRLRVVPTLGDLSPHLVIALAENTRADNGYTAYRSALLAYSFAQGFRVGKSIIGPDTPLSVVAEEILAGTSDHGVGIDWAYAGWYAELLAEAHRLGVVPVAGSYDTRDRLVWALGYNHKIPFPPPPPVKRRRAGFSEAFPRPSGAQVHPDSTPHAENVDVTKLKDLTALVASFSESHDHFVGLFAITPHADYRRERGAWLRYEKDAEIYEDVLVPVSYRFIKAFDILQDRGHQPDWDLADRMRVLGPHFFPGDVAPGLFVGASEFGSPVAQS